MPDLHERITAAVNARLEVARAASGRDDGTTPSGEHWRWECSNCDTPIKITPVTVLDELLQCPACDFDINVDIRSVEEYETRSVGLLPHMVTHSASEVRPVDALHIISHDPATVIRHCEATLAILAEVAQWRHASCADGWYSCSQATEEAGYPVDEACSDEDRDGQPCDCGLDRRRAAILHPLAMAYGVEVS